MYMCIHMQLDSVVMSRTGSASRHRASTEISQTVLDELSEEVKL